MDNFCQISKEKSTKKEVDKYYNEVHKSVELRQVTVKERARKNFK